MNLNLSHLVQFSSRFDAVSAEDGFRDDQTVGQVNCSFCVVSFRKKGFGRVLSSGTSYEEMIV